MDNAYQVLGVSENASQDEIKKAYRDLAKKWHPDHNANKEEASERFKLIATAYGEIDTKEKREAYDRRLRDPFMARGGSPFGDMSDFFRHTTRFKGPSLKAIIEVSLEEMANGTIKSFPIIRPMTCNSCNGQGGSRAACSTCHGSGIVEERVGRTNCLFVTQHPCHACKGEGSIVVQPCSVCAGRRVIEKEETIEVTIPRGIREGAILRIAGQGYEGDIPGDLLLIIKEIPHSRFERHGDDLFANHEISFIEALQGGKASFKGLRGETVWISIPKGCKYGHEVVFSGMGINNGSLHVILTFELPKLSDQQIENIANILAT